MCVVVRIAKCVVLAGTLSLFGGCQNVGPIAIDQGRDRYNHIIQQTSKEQTLANIIRIKHREPTTFMDVTEVDATTTFSGTANGALADIGAIAGVKSTSAGTINGQIGNVGGGVTYTESPLVRYQPLLGQALVEQLATPVSPDALASLYDSNWGAIPLLDFSAAYLTFDAYEFGAVLSSIGYLGKYQRLELVAEKSELTKGNDSTASGTLKKSSSGNVTLEVTNKTSTSTTTDTLVLYHLPAAIPHPSPVACYGDSHGTPGGDPQVTLTVNKRLTERDKATRKIWNRVLRIYAGTQAAPAQKPGPMCAAGKCTNAAPDRIELRTKPMTPDKMTAAHLISGAPVLRTYSAIGILKNSTEAGTQIGFVTPTCYHTIRSLDTHPWNNFKDDPEKSLVFFTLLPSDESGECRENPSSEENPSQEAQGGRRNDKATQKNKGELENTKYNNKRDSDLEAWLALYNSDPALFRLDKCFFNQDTPFIYAPNNVTDEDFVLYNNRLEGLRRYILIIHSDSLPADAYVAHFDRGEWYYIAGDDEISQRNFQLITLFMTIMAVPGGTQPLTPAITVGGSGG